MQSEIGPCNILTRWRVPVVNVSPIGHGPSVCPEDTRDSSLNSDLHRCSSWSTRLTDCTWRRSTTSTTASGSRSSEALVGRALRRCLAEPDPPLRRWRCFTVKAWNERLTMASLATVIPACCRRQSVQTKAVADLIVRYVIDEALIMCDWLYVFVWFPARSIYESRFGMVPC